MKELKFILFSILMILTFLGCIFLFFSSMINKLGIYTTISSLIGALTSILLYFIIKDIEQRIFNIEDNHIDNEHNTENDQDFEIDKGE